MNRLENVSPAVHAVRWMIAAPTTNAKCGTKNIMDNNRKEGGKHEAKGKVKETAGKMTGNKSKEYGGKAEKNLGKGQKNVGEAADEARKHD
jgi:uncharacterized protein YjbJ (UPF0337 family)